MSFSILGYRTVELPLILLSVMCQLLQLVLDSLTDRIEALYRMVSCVSSLSWYLITLGPFMDSWDDGLTAVLCLVVYHLCQAAGSSRAVSVSLLHKLRSPRGMHRVPSSVLPHEQLSMVDRLIPHLFSPDLVVQFID